MSARRTAPRAVVYTDRDIANLLAAKDQIALMRAARVRALFTPAVLRSTEPAERGALLLADADYRALSLAEEALVQNIATALENQS